MPNFRRMHRISNHLSKPTYGTWAQSTWIPHYGLTSFVAKLSRAPLMAACSSGEDPTLVCPSCSVNTLVSGTSPCSKADNNKICSSSLSCFDAGRLIAVLQRNVPFWLWSATAIFLPAFLLQEVAQCYERPSMEHKIRLGNLAEKCMDRLSISCRTVPNSLPCCADKTRPYLLGVYVP